MVHWHVASGLAGYGPDGYEDHPTATTLRETADLVSSELQGWAENEYESADALAGWKDYEEAWKTRKNSDYLEVLASNFNNDRANAPLYVDNPEAWDDTIHRMIAETFPLDVSHNSRLYVWDCIEPECEHAEPE